MCKFFSLISDGEGKLYYFNWAQRQAILAKYPKFNKVETADSHSSISSFFGFTGERADKVNKYEYNPLTKIFTVDQINIADDSEQVKKKCLKLDFKKIIEPLIIKPIVNPLEIKPKKVTKKDIELLAKWASVWASMWASVGASVRDSVWDSVRDSVRDSAWDSVGDSAWDSAWAYISSFFDIKYKYDFSPAIKLWERGFVSSFDGKTWRLHSGLKSEIVYEMKKGEKR